MRSKTVSEQGEIPAGVLIVLMALALGVAIWAVADEQIMDLVRRYK